MREGKFVKGLAAVFTLLIIGGVITASTHRKSMVRVKEHAASSNPSSAPRIPTPDWEQGPSEALHLNAALPWLEAARVIAERSQDRQAQLIVSFLKGRLVIGEPVNSANGHIAAKVLWAAEGPIVVWMIPMLPEDMKLGESWQRYAESKSVGAGYDPETSWIILRSEPMSPVWKGIVLLHEAEHARAYTSEHYDWQDAKTFCYKERDTHILQNRLMGKIGGATYRKIIDAEIDRMRRKIAEKNLPIGTAFPNREKYYPDLDRMDVFGPALSDLERDMRGTHVWIHAIFDWIDLDLPGTVEDKEDRKALFLKTIYRKGGVLPGSHPE